MKRMIMIIAALLCTLMLAGCSVTMPESTADVEAILAGVVESIDWEELQGYAEDGVNALTKKFPALKTLTDQEKMQQLVKENGLKLLSKYIDNTDPEVQENAVKLGEILKILNPELTDEVDAVLNP